MIFEQNELYFRDIKKKDKLKKKQKKQKTKQKKRSEED